MADFPYVYFDQGEDAPVAFFEEALVAGAARQEAWPAPTARRSPSSSWRINGYTVTSGILVGITDGSGAHHRAAGDRRASCIWATW